MEKTTLKGFKEMFVDTNFNVEHALYFAVQEENEITYGWQKDIDFEYCEEHNIPCYDLKRDGGAIVHFAGNVAWAEIKPNIDKDFRLTNLMFLNSLNKNLQEKGIKSVLEGNDILIDGCKVASGCAINLPPDYKRTFSAVQININCDVELIRNVCKKEMTKIPKALSDYGITTEDIVEFVKRYFKTNEN